MWVFERGWGGYRLTSPMMDGENLVRFLSVDDASLIMSGTRYTNSSLQPICMKLED